ncbi:hypothetical protein AGABI2DRAFT_145709 [Agaricus bisporus var. bisporus H97]|uniref:hypothetical protein n=1 Tax=Agaricus bisporus var. bisporus (strain H97 / ATCC MYA-4626 / FGSC 10389) TaxID=936046 RepID=UPI00029F6304|nr:hypothetical protein AGABI2DRAFT_145709 [Agaricus bisporus var. bisporus H97]EKV43407.1 hypothetical protein AGABI2DRAFT_145709 [Agaricus bisporus var. bisporus H97]
MQRRKRLQGFKRLAITAIWHIWSGTVALGIQMSKTTLRDGFFNYTVLTINGFQGFLLDRTIFQLIVKNLSLDPYYPALLGFCTSLHTNSSSENKMYMPIIHRARIEHPLIEEKSLHRKTNFKTVNLLPRSSSGSTTADYVVLSVLIAVPLATIVIWAMLHLVRLLRRPTETSMNSDRASDSRRGFIKVRNRTLGFHHDRNEDDNSVKDNIPDDTNLSLLSARPSITASGNANAPAPVASETPSLMRGPTVVSTMPNDSPLVGIGPSRTTQLGDLEERVQRLEGRFNTMPSGSEEYQNDIRAEDPLSDLDSEEEPLPPYTRLPASESESVVTPVVSTSPGWKMKTTIGKVVPHFHHCKSEGDSDVAWSQFNPQAKDFFPLQKSHRRFSMSPRRFTTRKDSFGLEIREDGSIGFSISPNEETAADLNVQKVAERRECGDDSPRIIGSDSWKSIVSLTRTKRRRDSFGLEVREDGTLSFDQLATDNGKPEASGNMRRKTTSGGMGIIGLRRTMTQPGRNRRRCDSFGLEIREDGTLSLNPEAGVRPAATRSSGNNSITNDDRMRGAQPSGTGGQVPDVEIIQRTRTRIHPQSTHIYPQNENNTSISFATNAHVTGSQMEHQPRLADEGRANSVEVDILRERVRILEAALAEHRPHFSDSWESDCVLEEEMICITIVFSIVNDAGLFLPPILVQESEMGLQEAWSDEYFCHGQCGTGYRWGGPGPGILAYFGLDYFKHNESGNWVVSPGAIYLPLRSYSSIMLPESIQLARNSDLSVKKPLEYGASRSPFNNRQLAIV